MSRKQRRSRQRRDYVIGETDPLSQALTFALGPVMFGLLGRWIGGMAGAPTFGLLVGIVLGVVGGAATLYYRFQARMDTLDSAKPWRGAVREDRALAVTRDTAESAA